MATMKMTKYCTNPTCGTRNMEVETDAENCISCGRELKNLDLSNLFSDGANEVLKKMFGG